MSSHIATWNRALLSGTISFKYQEDQLTDINWTSILQWLGAVIAAEEKILGKILYIFCTDEELLNINRQYLNHDDFTDIITFPYKYDPIEAEIYISVDRVKENAESFHVPFEEELSRVLVHGILHMCGYNDQSELDKVKMRELEDKFINIRSKIWQYFREVLFSLKDP